MSNFFTFFYTNYWLVKLKVQTPPLSNKSTPQNLYSLKTTLVSTFNHGGSFSQTRGLFTLINFFLIKAQKNQALFNYLVWSADFSFQIHLLDYLACMLLKFRFVALFFFEKLNKHIYKYSKYKRPRYSIKYMYIPAYKRYRALTKFLQKSAVFTSGRGFRAKLKVLIWQVFFNPRHTFFLKLLNWIQNFIFKSKRGLLIY